MITILLTGGTSFIGRHLAKCLAKSDIRVLATYRTANSSFNQALVAEVPNLKLIKLVSLDKAELDKLPPLVDAVLHLAGVSPMSGASIDDMLNVNVTGIRNLQCYAKRAGASKFIYASSLSVHGEIKSDVVDEHTPVNDPGIYGATKYLGERLLAESADTTPAIAIRLPGVLGSGAHRAWIPTLVDMMIAGKDVSIYNPNGEFNNAIHVNDLSRLITQILLNRDWRGFAAFPIGAAGKMTILEVASLLRDKLSSRSVLRQSNLFRPSFTIDSRCATSLFGYVPSRIDAVIVQYLNDYMSSSQQI